MTRPRAAGQAAGTLLRPQFEEGPSPAFTHDEGLGSGSGGKEAASKPHAGVIRDPGSRVSAGNMDRHHYETFEKFGNDTFIIHLDNGRG